MFLIANGVPFDIAFSLDDHRRFAFCIILRELKDAVRFNFNSMKFEEAK